MKCQSLCRILGVHSQLCMSVHCLLIWKTVLFFSFFPLLSPAETTKSRFIKTKKSQPENDDGEKKNSELRVLFDYLAHWASSAQNLDKKKKIGMQLINCRLSVLCRGLWVRNVARCSKTFWCFLHTAFDILCIGTHTPCFPNHILFLFLLLVSTDIPCSSSRAYCNFQIIIDK